MSGPQTTELPSDQRSATAERILDCAQAQIQRRGYNAVSYGDLAEELDLTTAAIHYHFPSKADLVQTLVQRYRRRNAGERRSICRQNDSLRTRLETYVELYTRVVEGGGLCLCGVLASDEPTLPAAVRREVRAFFREQEDWLTSILDAADSNGTGLHGCDTSRDTAQLLLAAIEGAMLTTPDRSREAYAATLQHLIDSVVT
jgi:TetR/AcrR family transcriptional repressor of nem operon